MKTTLRQLVAVSAFAAGLSAAISTAQSAVVNWNFEGVWTSVTGITDFSFFTYNSAQLTSLNSFGSTIAFTNPSSSIITARSEFGGYWQFGLSTPEGEVIVDGEGTGAFGLFEIMNRGDLDLDINPDVVDPTSIEVGLIVEFPESQLARTIRTSLFAQGYLTAFTRVGGDPSPVPVPAALPLLAAAIGAIGIVGRRRKSANR
jgi:hypothetical protein